MLAEFEEGGRRTEERLGQTHGPELIFTLNSGRCFVMPALYETTLIHFNATPHLRLQRLLLLELLLADNLAVVRVIHVVAVAV